MRRVLISGFYGESNSGDDALLAASTWGARRAFGADVALAATAAWIPRFPGSDAVRPTVRSSQRFRGEERLRRAWTALRAHSFVFGGGSVFHTAEQLDRLRRLLALSGPGPHLAAGVSLGPFGAVADERACARLLRQLRFVGLRDRASAAIAAALAPDVESRLTFDLAPLVLHLVAPAPAPAARRGVGLALCENERRRDPARDARRRERLVALACALSRRLDDELVLLDFNGAGDWGDHPVHAEVSARARAAGARVRHRAYDPRPLEVLREVASLRGIVTMRLHAAVFAYLASTPTVMLSYHPKCGGWSEQIGLPARLVHDSTAFEPDVVADALVGAVEGRVGGATLPVAAALERAALNFPELSAER